ncbi:hypothetical protein BKA56DRAFT_96399 [Ilyonectria sp. MPI-CAGE-AT-0026]|nr:hypothetical protein BKA56DRAFT_96399 [Ilyonectria sp. MPI-CAGE-AT-0026]
MILQHFYSYFSFLTSSLLHVCHTLTIMNSLLEITQWQPSQLQQKFRPSATMRIHEPRSSISYASSAQSIALRGETSSPIIVGVEDSTNADPHARVSSIEEISAEAMRLAADNSLGVGIGTLDPVALLDLENNGRVCSLHSQGEFCNCR